MKGKLIIGGVLLTCIVGCQNSSYTEALETKNGELQLTIKEQGQQIMDLQATIDELEIYKQEKEHVEQQARRTQQAYEEEQKRLNEEKYYMALSDVYIISQENGDETVWNIDYGNKSSMYVVDGGIRSSDGWSDYVPTGYSIRMPYVQIKSGLTFKLSDNDLKSYCVIGNYEEIEINTEVGETE